MADFELKGIPGEAAMVFQPFAQELLDKIFLAPPVAECNRQLHYGRLRPRPV